jgi:hypothetical protein
LNWGATDYRKIMLYESIPSYYNALATVSSTRS